MDSMQTHDSIAHEGVLDDPRPAGSTRKDMKSIARSSYRPLPSEEYMFKMAAQEADSIKQHMFSGAMGHRVLVDIKEPKPRAFGLGAVPEKEVYYRTSNSNFGILASQINPVTGENKLTGKNTGILYRMPQGHGLNGRFTTTLAQAGMSPHDGLNTSLTKARTLANPQQWGASAYSIRNA
ncbi:hypothetical protein KFE25_007973 [Diacronema lutheri]|uniref:Uncharacterized protein n=1 Tax=Diacronema lutheri TaxID=2081491 RepID=A0A8J5XU49_DIALT|nr:hypothetical protein KFE25_007973 [Diacronema lutheri]